MNMQDTLFLNSVYNENNIIFHTKILVLDKEERPIRVITGEVQPGSSISIQSGNAMRRSCSLTMLAREDENDLKNIDHLLSTNKKIKILVGIEKRVDYASDVLYFSKREAPFNENTFPNCGFPSFGQEGKIYVDRHDLTYWIWENDNYKQINSIYDYQTFLTWFPMGVYVITQPSITHATNGCSISLSCNDKMCLLDGSIGGSLPAEVDFGKYYQMVGKVKIDGDPTVDEDIGLSLVPNPNDYTIYIDKNTDTEYIWTKMYGFEKNEESTNSLSLTEPLNVPQFIYDIIRTSVINFGHENPSKVIINDVPLQRKQIHRNADINGNRSIYYNVKTGEYTLEDHQSEEGWKEIGLNEDVGYIYIDFIPPDLDEMIVAAGEPITSVLDKIKNKFGNYEYFYDIEGNFVFQEIKNYLNTSYASTEAEKGVSRFYLENVNKDDIDEIAKNNLKILDTENYSVDYYGGQRSVYTFDENTGLVSSYSNTLDYKNLKNDYHIWSNGDKDQSVMFHYHLVIKEKPQVFQTRKVVLFDKKNNENEDDIKPEDIGIRLALDSDDESEVIDYTPVDWRAELYLQGLEMTQYGSRPDVYQQELLDKFNLIYIWGDKPSKIDKNPKSRFANQDIIEYWVDIYEEIEDEYTGEITKKIVDQRQIDHIPKKAELDEHEMYAGSILIKSGAFNPNGLTYFIDYLEPVDRFYGLSVDDIGTRLIAKSEDNIVKMYNDEMPNRLLINKAWQKSYQDDMIKKGQENHLEPSYIDAKLYELLAPNTWGYSCEEKARDYLYQNTHYAESISLQCIPIYTLDVNQRITVKDPISGINGDFITTQITMPLSQGSTMSISASAALSRI